MNRAHTAPPKPANKPSPCGCKEPKGDEGCCELVCFERPSYFCGHLLTDQDLTTEQKYFIEKLKLYHRSFDGDGVVCGLKLTCDPNCHGSIRIGEGYALDDCGHDLVLCESVSMDVIDRLSRKGWLVKKPAPDPCLPEEEGRECTVRQCFYVTACYTEEPSDFEAPLASGCRPDLSECEPVRIREGVRFDVLNQLPEKTGALAGYRERVAGCFRLFSKGPFAESIRKNAGDLATILAETAQPGDNEKHFDLFCELRGLLLLHLDRHPDRYNCRLDDDVRRIPFPKLRHVSEPGHAAVPNYPAAVAHAFCRLLELARQNVLSCMFGELVPPCPQPCEPSCVVLGTVVVENGCLVQVCNYPRDYVWSFAHLFEVLLASVLGPVAGEVRYDDDGSKRGSCCAQFELDCREFIRLLMANQKAPEEAAAAPAEALMAMVEATRYSFDFTRSDAFAPTMFADRSLEKAMAAAETMGVQLEVREGERVTTPQQVATILQSFGLQTRDEPVLAMETDGVIHGARTWRHEGLALAAEEREVFVKQITEAREAATAAEQRSDDLLAEIGKLRQSELQIRESVFHTDQQIIVLRKHLEERLGEIPGDLAHRGSEPVEPGRCQAQTQKGARCKRSALEGSAFCSVHQPA